MKTPAPWIARQLAGLLQQRGHAWLLQGPSGLGQYELALGLAQAWLCEQPSPQGACGHCDSCHLVDGRAHPDFVALMPETVMLDLGWPLPESAQKEIDDKKRKPSKDIRVEALRDAVAFAQRTSARGRGLAVLVYPAERMNHISANALLKTLEEPPGDARFVLACEATQQLLPTIRSRCQSHAMQWPDQAEALDWLQTAVAAGGGPGPGRDQLQVWWRAAGGRPDDALAWGAAGLTAQVWAGLPAALARGDWSAMSGWPVAQQLEVLQKLCHDLMALASGAPPRYFAADQLPAPPRLVVLSAWSKELMAAARTVEHPFNANLMQDAWAARTRQVLRPRPVAAG
jgi:DNA polymerase-3 subunit delta'